MRKKGREGMHIQRGERGQYGGKRKEGTCTIWRGQRGIVHNEGEGLEGDMKILEKDKAKQHKPNPKAVTFQKKLCLG